MKQLNKREVEIIIDLLNLEIENNQDTVDDALKYGRVKEDDPWVFEQLSWQNELQGIVIKLSL